MERAICPILIGREDEIGILEDALLSANRGRGQVVLVAGEAGMGKTRLAAELERRAHTLGMTVLIGGCAEADLALPYLPFIEAVGNHLTHQDLEELRSRLGPVRRELAHLFPQLEPEGVHPDVDGAQGRLRLFEALLSLLRIPAEDTGLLVVVEDLHWADASTRELLDYLTRRLRGARILVVGTYRSDEMHRRHPLLPMVQAWRRSSAATVVQLEPLGPDRVASMVRAIFDISEVADDTRDFLHQRCEGNPFVLEEVLKAALDRGDIFKSDGTWTRKSLGEIRLPESVRDTILLRLDRLTPDQVEVLRAASVLGASSPYRILVQLCGLPETVVAAAVEECVRQQFLGDEPALGGRYGFRHALTREAIYEDMIAPQRETLHGRAADLLAAAGAPAVEVTFHLLAAGRTDEAVPLCLRAAEEASAAYANRDATALYLRALPHISQPFDRALTMCRLGEAFHLSGEVPQARKYLEAGIREVENADPVLGAHFRLILGRSHWEANRSDLALVAYEESRRVLETFGPSRDLSVAYCRLAGLRIFAFDAAAGMELASKALDVAEKAGDRGAAVWASSYFALTLAQAGRPAEAIEMLDRCYDEAVEGGHVLFAFNAVYNGIAIRFARLRNREVGARIELLRPVAIGPIGQGCVLIAEAMNGQLMGRPREAEEQLRRAVTLFSEAGSGVWIGRARQFLAAVLIDLDRLTEAREMIVAAGDLPEAQEQFRGLWDRIRLAVAEGDRDAAHTIVEEIRKASEWGTAERAVIGVVAVDALVHFGLTADAALVAAGLGEWGDDEAAAAAFVEGRLAAAAGDHGAAVALLRSAIVRWAEVEYRIDEWRARTRLAESLAAAGDLVTARGELESIVEAARAAGNLLAVRQATEGLAAIGVQVPLMNNAEEPAKIGGGFPTEPPGERLVTVMFADVRGYTALSRTAVPADVVDRIGALQRWATLEIERRHGLVDKFAGDAVMATFNVSGATVDHAVHALETALAVRDKASAMGLPLGIGIATGAAVVGALAPGANTSVVGETTNLASRLQARAEAGEVLISEGTQRRIAGWLPGRGLEVHPETLALKGFEEEVLAYRLR